MVYTLLGFLRSLRLTIGLFIGLAVLFAASALPGTDPVIGSPVFWILLALLGANTAACTITVLWRRPPTKLLRWGPHLIHIGLLFLLAGLSLSLLMRYEESITLEPGQTEHLDAGISLLLEEAREVHNEQGDLVNWESRVRIRQPGREIWTGTTAVNQPLRIYPFHLFQTDFEQRPAVQFKPAAGTQTAGSSPAGMEVMLAINEGYREGDTFWVLTSDAEGSSEQQLGLQDFFFLGYNDGVLVGRRTLEEGAAILGIEPDDTGIKILSGMRLGYDPGALPAAAGALLLGLGVTLYGIER
ncbi:MAG: cytochrome c biogenesis protein ResB [Spirochaeta sp.]